MVENIRNYYDILSRFEPDNKSPYAMRPALRLPELSPSRPSMAEVPAGP